jgi:hypothetical protein
MKHNESEIKEIANRYKKQFKLSNKIDCARFYPKINDGENYWIVTGTFELFGEQREFFYMISDETGNLIQTMNEHGVNPHLSSPMSKEWEDYTDEDEI